MKDACLRKVRHFIAEKKYEQAARLLDRSIAEHPEDPAGYTNFGNLLMAMGDSGRSVNFFAKALALDSGYGSAAFGYGNALFELGRYEEALSRFHEAQAAGVDDGDLFYMMGRCALELGRMGQALAAFQRAVELNGQDVEARFQYALALAKLGDLDMAEQQLIAVVDADAAHADAYYNLGVIAAFRHQEAEARRSFTRALQLNPRHVLAANGLKLMNQENKGHKG